MRNKWMLPKSQIKVINYGLATVLKVWFNYLQFHLYFTNHSIISSTSNYCTPESVPISSTKYTNYKFYC